MATTFRTNKELEELLSTAAELTGKPRSQIIREAVSQHCKSVLQQYGKGKTWHAVLSASGFEPVKSKFKDLSTNKIHMQKAFDESANRRST